MRSNTRKGAIIVYILGIACSIFSFIITLKTDPLGLSKYSQNPELPAFFFSVVILMLSDRISAMLQFAENKEISETIVNMIKSAHSVIAFRTPRDAILYINNRMSSLLSVESVSLNLDEEFSTTDNYLYRSDEYKKYLKFIAENVERGVIWRDIGDKYAEKKFSFIQENLSNKNIKGSFQTRMIFDYTPQITFLILGYHDGTKEALFNWDYLSPGAEPCVLLSRDTNIIQMFSYQFSNLWRIAS